MIMYEYVFGFVVGFCFVIFLLFLIMYLDGGFD